MPFRFRDETAGRDLLYVDNAGQLGLGSLPNSGQALTVNGQSIIDNSAQFAPSMFRPGGAVAIEGVVSVPPGGSTTILTNTGVVPTVSPTGSTSSAAH